ncbi:MAG: hypothetical protein M0C28_17700 [Candidatus Moduliflexus flocculans]|nr:hypothetical protein [Candidatus Moduliflexus flocculans]
MASWAITEWRRDVGPSTPYGIVEDYFHSANLSLGAKALYSPVSRLRSGAWVAGARATTFPRRHDR